MFIKGKNLESGDIEYINIKDVCRITSSKEAIELWFRDNLTITLEKTQELGNQLKCLTFDSPAKTEVNNLPESLKKFE